MKSIIINQPRSSYFIGGAEMVSLEHAVHISSLGYHVTFITIDPASIGLGYSRQYLKLKAQYKCIEFVELQQSRDARHIYDIKPGENRLRWNVESIFYSRELNKYLVERNGKYSHILSYYILDTLNIPNDTVSVNALYLCGVPKDRDDFQGSFLSMYNRVVAISDDVKAYWQDYSRQLIYTVKAGVDVVRYKPAGSTRADRIRVLYLGRITRRKNVATVIKSLNMVDSDKIDIDIVGDGPDLDTIEGIRSHHNIRFLGQVDNPEYYLARADILISPSIYGEGLQGAILEAMASGCIVIATNSKINTILLSEGRGIAVPPDENSIAAAVNSVLGMNDLEKEMIADRARGYVCDNYNWSNKVRQLVRRI
ncbi:MAG: glycosyltransferase, partial [Negativicutes bacterium]|nr:glycosyltransferase [Negativicutes bacterium]